jgi:cytochrome c biogenesis protein CcmG, thiol:disulfide interchange protein DsbE
LRSTRSSARRPGDDARRPSRTAIAILTLVSLAVPAILLALVATHGRRSSPTPTTDVAPIDTRRARVGTPAPDFSLPTTEGDTLELSTLRTRPVVLVFFASWCHPCEEELPVLERFARENAGRLAVVGVSYHDLESDSVAFVRRLHVTFPALIDAPDGPVAQRYGVRGIPQTVFVDADGVVRGRVYGETSRRALQPAISDLLAGRTVRPI